MEKEKMELDPRAELLAAIQILQAIEPTYAACFRAHPSAPEFEASEELLAARNAAWRAVGRAAKAFAEVYK